MGGAIGGQYGEDLILATIFKDKTKGFLVDVGAADGLHNSNSFSLLLRHGWGGVLVEPESSQYRELLERYNERTNVVCVQCAIGPNETDEAKLFCGVPSQNSDHRQSTTLVPAFREAMKKAHKISFKEQSVHVRTLTRLLRDVSCPADFDFLSIDAEGMNYKVWQTLDTSEFSPRVVCIEGKGYRMDGYREFCLTRGNTIYMREDICSQL